MGRPNFLPAVHISPRYRVRWEWHISRWHTSLSTPHMATSVLKLFMMSRSGLKCSKTFIFFFKEFVAPELVTAESCSIHHSPGTSPRASSSCITVREVTAANSGSGSIHQSPATTPSVSSWCCTTKEATEKECVDQNQGNETSHHMYVWFAALSVRKCVKTKLTFVCCDVHTN